MRLRFTLLAVPLATLSIAACGDDDTNTSASDTATEATTTASPTGTEQEAGTQDASEEDLATRASKLAEETRKLQEDVTASARSLVTGDPPSREDARKALAGQEDRARELATEAMQQLSADEVARDALVQANKRTARAADALQDFAKTEQQEALQRARSLLQQGEKDLRGIASDLLDQAPAEAREALESARKRLPEIPLP